MSGWIYISAGGCNRCNALEGYHETEPTRPHKYCQCTVTPVKEQTTTNWTLQLEIGDTGSTGPAFSPAQEQEFDIDLEVGVEWKVTVRCKDGTEFSEGKSETYHTTVTVTIEPGDDVHALTDRLIEEYGKHVQGKIAANAPTIAARLEKENCPGPLYA